MWDRMSSGVGGMFSNLGERTSPYSNRLTMAGLGMLSGGNANEGWSGAMQGLVAGSAMDTDRNDRRKRDAAIQALMNDPEGEGILSGITGAQQDYLFANPDVLDKVIVDRMSPPSAGVNINMGEYKIPTNYRAVEPGNPDAGVERIPGVLTEEQVNDRVKITKASSAIESELSRYEELVDKYGVELTPGVGRDQLVTVRQGIMLQLKELFNLGVLNGPDLALMENMLWNPVDPVGGTYSAVTGDAKLRAKSSAAELRRMMKSIGEENVGGNLTRNEDGTLTWSP
jgi:hypothetical protein